jgi:UDP-N-acetyl-2-amino-2-deoxyglucuronate dehydrogenase
MKNCNVGIAGYGWVATAHVTDVDAAPPGQVTAACCSRKLDAAALSTRHGGSI